MLSEFAPSLNQDWAMGEKIANLAQIDLKGTVFNLEINASATGASQHDFHLQSAGMRLDFDVYDLLMASSALLNSADKLRTLKKIDKPS